ncbi:hypothetical protein JTB14_008224 [Gonioctena quinquepunctata]|nr:hypothetical protein JTB14_008224 [Gonioctena quinquepunctata]
MEEKEQLGDSDFDNISEETTNEWPESQTDSHENISNTDNSLSKIILDSVLKKLLKPFRDDTSSEQSTDVDKPSRVNSSSEQPTDVGQTPGDKTGTDKRGEPDKPSRDDSLSEQSTDESRTPGYDSGTDKSGEPENHLETTLRLSNRQMEVKHQEMIQRLKRVVNQKNHLETTLCLSNRQMEVKHQEMIQRLIEWTDEWQTREYIRDALAEQPTDGSPTPGNDSATDKSGKPETISNDTTPEQSTDGSHTPGDDSGLMSGNQRIHLETTLRLNNRQMEVNTRNDSGLIRVMEVNTRNDSGLIDGNQKHLERHSPEQRQMEVNTRNDWTDKWKPENISNAIADNADEVKHQE